MKHITLVILLIGAIQICGPAIAADLEITEVNGTVVALRNVIIDYTQYGMLYKPGKISTGIRLWCLYYSQRRHCSSYWKICA